MLLNSFINYIIYYRIKFYIFLIYINNMNIKSYHYYFFIIKFLIIICIGFLSMKIIKIEDKDKDIIINIIDSIFKLSIGLFLIIFFSSNWKCNYISICDRSLLILSGFILILLADFKKFYDNIILFNK